MKKEDVKNIMYIDSRSSILRLL